MSVRPAGNQASVVRREEGSLVSVEVVRPGLREFYLTGVPHGTVRAADAAAQAREVYGVLSAWLRERGAAGVQERVFGSLEHREAILAQRRLLLAAESDVVRWPATFIEGAPCGRDGLAGVHLYAVAGPACSPVHRQQRLCGVAFEHRDAVHTYLSGVTGLGVQRPAREEAGEMFSLAEAILREAGGSYGDVVRTWIYVADILEWYDEFNEARTAFYSGRFPDDGSGARWLPASTGIGGRPPAGARCLMDVFALRGPGRDRIAVEAVRNPRQSEAYMYGSDFSRGVSVAFDGAETLHVSGTAAIDEEGRSVCAGSLHGQVLRTLDNIASLLATRSMTLDHLACSTVFVKRDGDAEAVRQLIDDRGGQLANGIFLTADICRSELLFEADGLAVSAAQ